jgi:hypothetical protein
MFLFLSKLLPLLIYPLGLASLLLVLALGWGDVPAGQRRPLSWPWGCWF